MSMRIPGQIVVFAMMITGLAGAAAAQGNAPAVRSILVTGEGEASGPPDRAQVSAGVQTVAKSVAQASQVTGCTKVGEVSADVLYKILFVNRSQTRVARELEILARNRAGKFEKANRIVATSPIERGSQTFDAYSCK